MTAMAAPPQQQNGTRTFQGQTVPAESVDPVAFYINTRRKNFPEKKRNYAGLGGTDSFELTKADLISQIRIRFTGTLAVVHGTGSVAATFRWPYDLIRVGRFTANGASNLLNCSGLKYKFREIAKNTSLNDRGVSQSVSNATVTQGTLSQASESWGVGPGQTAIASGNYAVDLQWVLPVAEDEKDLTGLIFAQTSSMDLNLVIDWEQLVNLFTVTGNDTVALTGTVEIEVERYSIPIVGGRFIVPDLSLFHSMVQARVSNALGQGDNAVRLTGQGSGRRLLRLFYQVWNGAAPQVPLAVTDANFGQQSWTYGTNETPETFTARALREWNERLYASDVGAIWGFMCHEFETSWAFKDAVDMGAASELRFNSNVAIAPTNPGVEYVQEVMFAAGTAA